MQAGVHFFFKNTVKYCFSFLVIFLTINCDAQYKINYGLSQPQDSTTLPESKTTLSTPVRKSKVIEKTILKSVGNNELAISGGWELIQASKIDASGEYISQQKLNTDGWYNATVPGTVLTTLVDQGVYPDPYFGLNNLTIPDDLCRQKWWYRTTFSVPQNLNNKNLWLILNGINYKADIWLNGKLLGEMRGAFKRGNYEISKQLKENGENILAICIFPPDHPGIPHEESAKTGTGPNGGLLTLDGPTFIASEGWDWVPGIRDRNIGIWQDIRLKTTGPVTIVDPQVITDLPLPDTTRAKISIRTEIFNNSDRKKTVLLMGRIGKINFSKQIIVNPAEHKHVCLTPEEFKQLNLKNPRLWWPNGYGSPELYHLELTAIVDEDTSDVKSIRFGIRELSYDLTVDFPNKKGERIEFNPIEDLKSGEPLFDNQNRREIIPQVYVPSLLKDINPKLFKKSAETGAAPYLVIRVNGKKIYCKGGNWGMDDAMKRVSRERLEPYFKLHKDAHFNMIRNWTGESTEDVFYELCDENGMLVWNDFWLSTEGYNLNVLDQNLFLENAEDVIKRFRNHPSIAVWCPRNEGYAPASLDLKLAKLIAKDDATRLYQGNSRLMNLRASGPWDYLKDAQKYYSIANGFSTELGTPSVPTASSMRKMMPKQDLWSISDTWFYHDLHNGQKDYIRAIDSLYGPATDLDDFCKKAQMINYESHRAMFEAWNSKLWNNTTGLLLWMTHPAWPSTVWQVYSWDYETFGSYFASQKACEPVHVQMNLNDNEVMVVNSSLRDMENAKVYLNIYNLKGESLFNKMENVQVFPNQLNKVFKMQMPPNLPGNYLVRLSLKDKKGNLISDNDYWRNNGKTANFLAFNDLKNVKLDVKISDVVQKKDFVSSYFTISNNTSTPALAVKLNIKGCLSKKIVLPAYFSEGYFTLLPGERKNIKVEYPAQDGEVEIATDGYNIDSSKNVKIAFND